jgi:hypothetical protein
MRTDDVRADRRDAVSRREAGHPTGSPDSPAGQVGSFEQAPSGRTGRLAASVEAATEHATDPAREIRAAHVRRYWVIACRHGAVDELASTRVGSFGVRAKRHVRRSISACIPRPSVAPARGCVRIVFGGGIRATLGSISARLSQDRVGAPLSLRLRGQPAASDRRAYEDDQEPHRPHC